MTKITGFKYGFKNEIAPVHQKDLRIYRGNVRGKAFVLLVLFFTETNYCVWCII
jgi:hypothetical protein